MRGQPGAWAFPGSAGQLPGQSTGRAESQHGQQPPWSTSQHLRSAHQAPPHAQSPDDQCWPASGWRRLLWHASQVPGNQDIAYFSWFSDNEVSISLYLLNNELAPIVKMNGNSCTKVIEKDYWYCWFEITIRSVPMCLCRVQDWMTSGVKNPLPPLEVLLSQLRTSLALSCAPRLTGWMSSGSHP